MADERGLVSIWRALRSAVDGYLEPQAVPANSPVAPYFEGLKEGDSFPFPSQDQIGVGTSGLVRDTAQELMAWIFASRAEVTSGNTMADVLIEDCVIKEGELNRFVQMTPSVRLRYMGEYDTNNTDLNANTPESYNGAEAAIAAQNALNKSVYRCTWTSRHYAPPSATTVDTIVPEGTLISGRSFKLKNNAGETVGHLFRHTSLNTQGETLASDAWLLRANYQIPQGTGTTASWVDIVLESATADLRSFLLAQINSTDTSLDALDLYSATSYRIRKYSP